MRILVTGVTGQVGGALQVPLQMIGDVVAAGRGALDLSRPDAIAAALDRLAPDLIVNPAAYTAVDRAEDERDAAFRANAEAPGAIARWAAARRIPLVHFSTDYVFDGSGQRPWREDDPTGPLSIYGASKLAGEAAIRAAGGPHLIVRTSWVYAAKGTNFLRTITRLAREREELRIVADQIGAPTTARVIADVVAAVIRENAAALPDAFARAGGLVHVATSGATSWHGFATAIVEGLRARGVKLAVERVVPIRTEDYPVKATRPRNSRLDLTRLAEVFGIVPPLWSEALAIELDALAVELKQEVSGGLR
jgi:dTDP-4-dehydrorhamnose reductase